jgi:hypothetical protein
MELFSGFRALQFIGDTFNSPRNPNSASKKRVSRRTFLQTGAMTAAGVAAAACQSTDKCSPIKDDKDEITGFMGVCTDAEKDDIKAKATKTASGVVSGEKPKEVETTVKTAFEQSVAFIQSEIDNNRTLNNLSEYGQERFVVLMNHIVVVYNHLNGTQLPEEMSQLAFLITNQQMQELDNQIADTFGLPHTDTRRMAGKTYTNTNNDRVIAINSEANFHHLAVLQHPDNRSRFPNLPETVLESFIKVAFHECHHYDAGEADIPKDDQKVYISSSGSLYTFTERYGFGLKGGSQPVDGEYRPIMIYGNLDELTVELIHQETSEMEDAPEVLVPLFPPPQDYLELLEHLYSSLGSTTREEIHDLHRAGGVAILELIADQINPDHSYPNTVNPPVEHIQKMLTMEKTPVSSETVLRKRQEVIAFQFLNMITNMIDRRAPAAEIRSYIDVVLNPGTAIENFVVRNQTVEPTQVVRADIRWHEDIVVSSLFAQRLRFMNSLRTAA